MLGVLMNVLCFVLMVCWNKHMASMKCTYVVLIQCSWLVAIYAWHGYFRLACINKACQIQFQGQPMLKILNYNLWNTKCHLCGTCESCVNFTLYLVLSYYNDAYKCVAMARLLEKLRNYPKNHEGAVSIQFCLIFK